MVWLYLILPITSLRENRIFQRVYRLKPVGVAIPHTDHKYVRQNAISVGILAEPVNFEDMGGEPDPVPVRVVFMLALGESNKQLNVLGWIMDVIQDEDFYAAVTGHE
ncbi:PTS suar transporter subunit IIA [Salmonella enterica subsp. enterica]|uniref:PTS suar transporter subunit IIA n=1 Tax=Salmonella enterica I TaxID=59201 RepID=A0A447TRY8_SALET|nr:PTS suar transporter subunit IIA [Salmonella enterica subsp. enterica]